MMNPPLIQKSSVAAAEIDQPEFADILQMNKRVSARHFRRLQYDRVGGGSSERATAFDRMPFAVGRFQPGTFLWGCAHAEACYQRSRWAQSVFQRGQPPPNSANAKRRRGPAAQL